MLKRFYFISSEKLGVKHVEVIKKYIQMFGGWPVVEGRSWDYNKFNWIELIKNFIKYGFNDDSILNVACGVNFTNILQKLIDVSISN